ncbi:MAG TPA: DUF3394 domain-containing protein, partial [Desulfobacteraceae bacterium]|nr:DUF3394 domain-containing protein [Desulfobacteraceae bacterium]
ETMNGSKYTKEVMLPVGDASTGAERIRKIGFETRTENGSVFVEFVVFASKAEKIGIDFDQEIIMVKIPADRPPKELAFIPALVLLSVIFLLQRKRRHRLEAAEAVETAT